MYWNYQHTYFILIYEHEMINKLINNTINSFLVTRFVMIYQLFSPVQLAKLDTIKV